MSRPPGVDWISCSLRLTATFALVVSTVGEAPVTVMVSATLASFIDSSTGVVCPTRTWMFSRMMVWNPASSILTTYVPGTSEGNRLTPPASVTPVMDPATSTGLLIVIVTPGTTPPCSSVALTRMLPV